MIYPFRWLIALGLGAFVLGLLLLMPLRLLLSPVPLERWGIAVQETSGSLLVGEARLVTSTGPLHVDWGLRPWRLLMLQLGVDWHGRLGEVQGEGQFGLAPWGANLGVAHAVVPAGSLNLLLLQWQARVDQPLTMREVTVSLWPTGRVRSAAGEFIWGAGVLQVSGRAPLDIPALHGQVRRDDAVIELAVVTERDPEGMLARGRYDTGTREVHLALLQRGADLLGQQTPSRSPDTAVFEMRQTLP